MMHIAEQPRTPSLSRSLAEQLAHVTEAAALLGLRLRTKYHQPYGWELYTAGGDVVASGSLTQLSTFLSGPRS